MDYANRERVGRYLDFIPYLIEALESVRQRGDAADPIHRLAQERILQLAIEAATDVGNLMIDGFVMRDASSYEDIIVILHDEQVIGDSLFSILLPLVELRKPLMQNYIDFDRTRMHSLVPELAGALAEFAASVRRYLEENK